MSRVPPPSDWDWVQARHSCAIAAIFRQLELDAQLNVEKRQALVKPDRDDFGFRFESRDKMFLVSRVASRGARTVVFRLTSDHINVERLGGEEILRATVTLNNDGECRLRVEGQELDRWQLLRRALEGLFFDGP